MQELGLKRQLSPPRPAYVVLNGLMSRHSRRPEGEYGEQMSSGITSRAWYGVHFRRRCEACFTQAPMCSTCVSVRMLTPVPRASTTHCSTHCCVL